MSNKINEYHDDPGPGRKESIKDPNREVIDLLKSMNNALDALVYYATPSRGPGDHRGLEKSIGSVLTKLGNIKEIKGSDPKQRVEERYGLRQDQRATKRQPANVRSSVTDVMSQGSNRDLLGRSEYRADVEQGDIGTSERTTQGTGTTPRTSAELWQGGELDAVRRPGMQDVSGDEWTTAMTDLSGHGFAESTQIKGSELKQIVAEELEKNLYEQQKHALGGPSNPYEKYSIPNLVSLTGDTPEDIVQEMQEAGIEITDETAARAAMNAGVVDDDLPDFVDAIMEIAHHGDTMLHEGRSNRVRARWKSPLSEPLYEMIEQSVEASGIGGLGKMWEYDRILVDEVDEWFAEGHFGEDPEEFERAKMEVFQYVKAMFP